MNVAEVIEESLGRALEPDLIQTVPELTLSNREQLLHDYETYAVTFSASRPSNEFWPYSSKLLSPKWQRNQGAAESSVRRSMSLLLYCHGLYLKDWLRYLLLNSLTPNRPGGRKPSWDESEQAALANYFETLAFIRPLIDAGIIDVLLHTTHAVGYGEVPRSSRRSISYYVRRTGHSVCSWNRSNA